MNYTIPYITFITLTIRIVVFHPSVLIFFINEMNWSAILTVEILISLNSLLLISLLIYLNRKNFKTITNITKLIYGLIVVGLVVSLTQSIVSTFKDIYEGYKIYEGNCVTEIVHGRNGSKRYIVELKVGEDKISIFIPQNIYTNITSNLNVCAGRNSVQYLRNSNIYLNKI